MEWVDVMDNKYNEYQYIKYIKMRNELLDFFLS